jgi:hypothetical protein
MDEFLSGYAPVLQALLATLFTWGVTAMGAGLVFIFKTINRKVLNGMLGFAAGVMIAASFWSLLAPAIEMAEEGPTPAWLVAAIGFLAGCAFLFIVDKILPHLHRGAEGKSEGVKTGWQRSVLLVLAITLHNIPEGLAVGVAFGAAAYGLPSASVTGAVHRTAELPGGRGSSDTAQARRFVPQQGVSFGPGFGAGGADRRRHRRAGGGHHAIHPPLCFGVRGGRDDLCGGGRADPRSAAG